MKIINIFLVSALFTVVAVPVAIACPCSQKLSDTQIMYQSNAKQNVGVNQDVIQNEGY